MLNILLAPQCPVYTFISNIPSYIANFMNRAIYALSGLWRVWRKYCVYFICFIPFVWVVRKGNPKSTFRGFQQFVGLCASTQLTRLIYLKFNLCLFFMSRR